MNKKEHMKFAKYVAEQTYIQEMERFGIQRDPFKDLIAKKTSTWIGKNIGTLPDKLEPAVNQYHRGLLHSKDAFWKIEEWKTKLRENNSESWQINIGLIMALTAYQSHIALDSTTPMGVPDYQWVWDMLKAFKGN